VSNGEIYSFPGLKKEVEGVMSAPSVVAPENDLGFL
jgi:hypothetical protein